MLRVVIRGRRGPGAWGKGGELLTNSYSWALCSTLYQCTSYMYTLSMYTIYMGFYVYTEFFCIKFIFLGTLQYSAAIYTFHSAFLHTKFIHTLITSHTHIIQAIIKDISITIDTHSYGACYPLLVYWILLSEYWIVLVTVLTLQWMFLIQQFISWIVKQIRKGERALCCASVRWGVQSVHTWDENMHQEKKNYLW